MALFHVAVRCVPQPLARIRGPRAEARKAAARGRHLYNLLRRLPVQLVRQTQLPLPTADTTLSCTMATRRMLKSTSASKGCVAPGHRTERPEATFHGRACPERIAHTRKR